MARVKIIPRIKRILHVPKTCCINIIYDPFLRYEKHKHVIQPGHLYLKRGDKVVFMTRGTAAKIFIPRADILFGIPKNSIIDVSGSGHSVAFNVQRNAPTGWYPYSSYCKNGNDFAEGGTSPGMIVDP